MQTQIFSLTLNIESMLIGAGVILLLVSILEIIKSFKKEKEPKGLPIMREMLKQADEYLRAVHKIIDEIYLTFNEVEELTK